MRLSRHKDPNICNLSKRGGDVVKVGEILYKPNDSFLLNS
jgi:hypothetical protein